MFINKFKYRFSLISSGKDSEEKQIFLVSTIQGNEIFYYSGFRISPKNFIKRKINMDGSLVYIQEAKKGTFNKSGDSSQRINSRLKKLELATQTVYERFYKNQDLEINKNDFKKYLQIELGEYEEVKEDNNTSDITFFDYYKKYMSDAKVSEGRRRQISSDINKLKRYQDSLKNDITFDNFNILNYKKYLKEGRTRNTIVSILKRLRTFFNYCKNELCIIDRSPFDNINFADKIGTEIYNEPVCLTRDELTKLYNTKYNDDISAIVKDMFCLQAALGCRVNDFIRLTYDNIQNGTLSYFPSKTKEYANKVIVPLSDRAISIIEKYRSSNRKLIMPFIHPNEYNANLKTVFRIANLDRKVIQFNIDEGKEEITELYNLATSHLARRTFVDILCQAGEPIHVVASMSGHSEHSKAFDRYRRRPEQLQIQAVKRSMD